MNALKPAGSFQEPFTPAPGFSGKIFPAMQHTT